MTRNQQILTAYLAGETVTNLAQQHGVSRQRINTLVREMGAPHRRPGMALTKRGAHAINSDAGAASSPAP